LQRIAFVLNIDGQRLSVQKILLIAQNQSFSLCFQSKLNDGFV